MPSRFQTWIDSGCLEEVTTLRREGEEGLGGRGDSAWGWGWERVGRRKQIVAASNNPKLPNMPREVGRQRNRRLQSIVHKHVMTITNFTALRKLVCIH